MATLPSLGRQKISTTISPEALTYLQRLIEQEEVRNLAEAIDLAVQKLKIYENRERLADDTAAYYLNMTDEEAAEEQKLESTLSQSSARINFDR